MITTTRTVNGETKAWNVAYDKDAGTITVTELGADGISRKIDTNTLFGTSVDGNGNKVEFNSEQKDAIIKALVQSNGQGVINFSQEINKLVPFSKENNSNGTITQGQYNRSTDEISLNVNPDNANMFKDIDKLSNTLMHEGSGHGADATPKYQPEFGDVLNKVNTFDFDSNPELKAIYDAELSKFTNVAGDEAKGNCALGNYMTRAYGNNNDAYEVTAETAGMSYTSSRLNQSEITMMTHFPETYKAALNDLARKNETATTGELISQTAERLFVKLFGW